MSAHYNHDDVKTFIAPEYQKREIDKTICPGCMRQRKGVYFVSGALSPFCDRFCEEIERKHHERRSQKPWEPSRKSFFVESATGVESPPLAREIINLTLTQKETAQYEPAYFE